MSNDLTEIKKRIYEEDKIRDILEGIGCQHVRKSSNRYEAQLPERFDSNNKRAVQVRNNEYLNVTIWNQDFSKKSIFDLVSYLHFDKHAPEELDECLSTSKRWICELLGYTEYLGAYRPKFKKADPLQWLKDLKRQRRRKTRQDNVILDESVLEAYVDFPSYDYLQQGIGYETQISYGVNFDLMSKRIVFPAHNRNNELIGVKGRTILDLENEKYSSVPKFLYLYNFNKGVEFFNLNRALPYILEMKEVIIFEAEKSCKLAYEYGFYNTIAIGGFEITEYQIEILYELGIEIRIVLAYDKDKGINDVLSQAKKFNKSRRLYAIYDYNDLLPKEDAAPVDFGNDIFTQLYNDYRENIDNQYRIIL